QGDVVWGIERRTDRSGGEFPGADLISSAKPNVWVSLYQAERRHLVATCEAALRANVDERLVRLAEMQGGRIVAALNGIFDDLGLSPEQRGLLPVVVPEGQVGECLQRECTRCRYCWAEAVLTPEPTRKDHHDQQEP